MSDHFDQAFARLQARVDWAKQERKRKWKTIQERSPGIADFLLEVNQEFGKPAKVWVEIDGEKIL